MLCVCVHSTSLAFFLHSGINLCRIPFSRSDFVVPVATAEVRSLVFGATCAGETKSSLQTFYSGPGLVSMC